MGCFGAKWEWIPRLNRSFMVGYVKFNAFLNIYRFCQITHVLGGLPGKFWSCKCFTTVEVSERSNTACTSKFFSNVCLSCMIDPREA
jgi:hypothetical protein